MRTTEGNKKIQIITRNAQPLIPCDECGAKPAVQTCTECQWSGMKRAGFVKGVLKPMDVMKTCSCPLSTRPGPVFVAIPVTGNARTAC